MGAGYWFPGIIPSERFRVSGSWEQYPRGTFLRGLIPRHGLAQADLLSCYFSGDAGANFYRVRMGELYLFLAALIISKPLM